MSLIMKFNGNMNVTANLIKKHREAKKLSYEELSAKLALLGISIHKQSLYDIEINKRTVKDYELFGLAYILDINIDNLFLDIKKDFDSTFNDIN